MSTSADQTASEVAYPTADLVQHPFPFFAEERERHPVSRDPRGHYLVFRHEDIAAALQQPDVFRCAPHDGHGGPLAYEGGRMLGHVDGPAHTVMRRMFTRPLTPGRLKAWRDEVQAIADSLIDRFDPAGTVEFVEAFAAPIPALVLCRLISVSGESEEYQLVRGWTRSLIEAAERRVPAEQLAVGGLHGFLAELVQQRSAQPGEDVLSELIGLQREQEGELDLGQIVTLASELVAGGIITTAMLIANAMMLLLRNPDQLERVQNDSSLILPMLEETLRLESPVQSKHRWTSQDVVLGGTKIPAGSDVLLVYASGNRDEERFADAERFDVDRPPRTLKRHLGFGLGEHFCLGAPLARMEATIAFERLLARLTNFRLTDPSQNDFVMFDSYHFRSIRTLHVSFDLVS
jgi:cytochrome P450